MKLVLLTGPFLGVRLALKGELHDRVSPCTVQRYSHCLPSFTATQRGLKTAQHSWNSDLALHYCCKGHADKIFNGRLLRCEPMASLHSLLPSDCSRQLTFSGIGAESEIAKLDTKRPALGGAAAVIQVAAACCIVPEYRTGGFTSHTDCNSCIFDALRATVTPSSCLYKKMLV